MSKPSLLKSFHLCCAILSLPCSMTLHAEALRFATYASERPSEELRKMEPFHLYLEQALAKQGTPTDIKMRIFPTYEEAIEAVVSGETDFARLGPACYVIAKKKNPNLQMLVVESNHGGKSFNGVIMVAAGSPIHSLSDLKGKRFAFGDPNSTTSRYLPQEALVNAGITGRELAKYDYIGRHDKVVFAVASGDYAAGAANETTLEKYGQAKGLRKLSSFVSPTHAWVARAGLEAQVVKRLQKALLNMKGNSLKYIGRDGFLSATDADFDSLRSSMRRARAFDD